MDARLLALYRELKQATDDAERQSIILRQAQDALAKTKRERSEAAEQNEWLAQVHQLIAQAPRWWALLPPSMRVKRERRRLKQANLFDSDTYLKVYPDVAAAKMDPLYHYIFHGFGEGRKLFR
ncbi:hypothetical protein [Aurantiacibacter flavus]|uniref:Uncharacterized protein n=1 Tax=Aurantiacibacter flavus TaxID=3145232 RepID=A0ABV0CZ15_9SPHN